MPWFLSPQTILLPDKKPLSLTPICIAGSPATILMPWFVSPRTILLRIGAGVSPLLFETLTRTRFEDVTIVY
ncbi:MAG: hypothetical protein V4722_05690 [Bacteroidota bacterium]